MPQRIEFWVYTLTVQAVSHCSQYVSFAWPSEPDLKTSWDGTHSDLSQHQSFNRCPDNPETHATHRSSSFVNFNSSSVKNSCARACSILSVRYKVITFQLRIKHVALHIISLPVRITTHTSESSCVWNNQFLCSNQCYSDSEFVLAFHRKA